jgi:hypothetical protein
LQNAFIIVKLILFYFHLVNRYRANNLQYCSEISLKNYNILKIISGILYTMNIVIFY